MENFSGGLLWNHPNSLKVVRKIHQSKYLTLSGVYCHCGNSYKVRDKCEIDAIQNDTIDRLIDFADRYCWEYSELAG